MVSELIRSVESKADVTPTQKLAAFINAQINETFDLVSFCETRGIDMSSLWKISRLYQLGETALVDFWNYCLQNSPELIEVNKDPEKLYQNVLSFHSLSNGNLRFLEIMGFAETEIIKLESGICSNMVQKLDENKNLVKANIDYLKEIGVKNIGDIFNEYYELFLMDHSNFVGIFNKYDPEDLIEKLVKNVAIIEYL